MSWNGAPESDGRRSIRVTSKLIAKKTSDIFTLGYLDESEILSTADCASTADIDGTETCSSRVKTRKRVKLAALQIRRKDALKNGGTDISCLESLHGGSRYLERL